MLFNTSLMPKKNGFSFKITVTKVDLDYYKSLSSLEIGSYTLIIHTNGY